MSYNYVIKQHKNYADGLNSQKWYLILTESSLILSFCHHNVTHNIIIQIASLILTKKVTLRFK